MLASRLMKEGDGIAGAVDVHIHQRLDQRHLRLTMEPLPDAASQHLSEQHAQSVLASCQQCQAAPAYGSIEIRRPSTTS